MSLVTGTARTGEAAAVAEAPLSGERLVEVGKAILQLCSVVKGELETIAKPKLLGLESCNPSPAATFPGC